LLTDGHEVPWLVRLTQKDAVTQAHALLDLMVLATQAPPKFNRAGFTIEEQFLSLQPWSKFGQNPGARALPNPVP
jgi:hypothetical protein